MDRVFLDANALFSAAYSPASPPHTPWRLPDTRLLTSVYAAAEARRNLTRPVAQIALQSLLDRVESAYNPTPENDTLFETFPLVAKDRPLILAAIHLSATHLLAGDVRHFGPYYGRSVGGVLVLRPATYLQQRNADAMQG